jgi:hypothetical protein
MVSQQQTKLLLQRRAQKIAPSEKYSLKRGSKNIRIVPIVIAELELANVEHKIFLADLMERANRAVCEHQPGAFNRIRMDRADNIIAQVRTLSQREERRDCPEDRNDNPNYLLPIYVARSIRSSFAGLSLTPTSWRLPDGSDGPATPKTSPSFKS